MGVIVTNATNISITTIGITHAINLDIINYMKYYKYDKYFV